MKLLECWKTARYYYYETGEVKIIKELEVSNLGNFRYSNTKKPLYINKKSTSYPKLQPYVNKVQIILSVHILVASTFLNPPKEKYFVVDHINKNKLDFSLENLRFVTSSTNLKNRSVKRKNRYLIEVSNNYNKILNCKKVSESLRVSPNSEISKGNFLVCSEDLFLRLDEKNNLDLILKWENDKNIDWRKIGPHLYLNNEGVLKSIKNKLIFYTFGRINGGGYYVTGGVYKKYSNLVHRILSEVFMNNDSPIDNKIPIDHLDTNKLNNSISNLKICFGGQSENINNEITLSKLKKKVKCLTINGEFIFDSRNSAAKVFEVSPATIKRWIANIDSARKIFPGILKIEFYNGELPANKNITLDELGVIRRFAKNSRDIKTIEDINLFILENKITGRSDLIKRGYNNIYEKIKTKKWADKITYYKGEDK